MVKRTINDVPKPRSRAQRWSELRDLQDRLDALMAMNVHIDIVTGNRRETVDEVAQFEKDRDRVSRVIQRELSALTADALNADLRHKMLTKEGK